MATAEMESHGVMRGVLESVSDERIVLNIPGMSYQLHLVPSVPASSITTPIGKRIKGTIHAVALRMFEAAGGGRFMEPISGEPRIVAGQVKAVDEANRRVLVDTGVPMWLTLDERQPGITFTPGQMINCYVQSGAQFTPA